MIQYHPICKSESNHRFALEQEGEKMLMVIGLNPSTADEKEIDPTMGRILGIVNTCGYDGYVMLNLSSERSTKPENMAKELDEEGHRKNLKVIKYYDAKYPNADILLAFGNKVTSRRYLSISYNDIWDILSQSPHRWLRIGGPDGITGPGHPRHPLYSRSDAGLDVFDASAYRDKLMKRIKRR